MELIIDVDMMEDSLPVYIGHSPIEVNRVRQIYVSRGADLTGIGRRRTGIFTNVKRETER